MSDTAAATQTALQVAPADKPVERRPMQIGSSGLMIQDLDGLWRFSQFIAKSKICPKDYQGNVEDVFSVVQYGLEIGLTPMAALQNIASINGRPSLWGDAQLALIRAQKGILERYEEAVTNNEIDPVFREMCFETDAEKIRAAKVRIAKAESGMRLGDDDYGFTVFVKRAGMDEAFDRFTVADAKRAGLWGKQGPWTNYPKRMLKFRARGFLLRDQFGDVLKGLISQEEARDIPPDRTTVYTQPARETPAAALAALPAPKEPEPEKKTAPAPAKAEPEKAATGEPEEAAHANDDGAKEPRNVVQLFSEQDVDNMERAKRDFALGELAKAANITEGQIVGYCVANGHCGKKAKEIRDMRDDAVKKLLMEWSVLAPEIAKQKV